MTTQDKVQAINEWNDQNGYGDDIIYDFDEHTVNDMFSNAWSIVQAIHFGNVNYSHGYFKFNGYGNIETLSDWEIESELDWNSVSEWLNENPEIAENHGIEVEII